MAKSKKKVTEKDFLLKKKSVINLNLPAKPWDDYMASIKECNKAFYAYQKACDKNSKLADKLDRAFNPNKHKGRKK